MSDTHIYKVGDTGPVGGFILIVNDNYEKDGWRYIEAAPCCIAKTDWDEANRLCTENTHWDRRDWELPDRASLVSLLRLPLHGDCIDFWAPGYHWTNERGLSLTFWGPTGYFGSTAGHFLDLPAHYLCAVRPVRKFL